jgi:hypothetical protein
MANIFVAIFSPGITTNSWTQTVNLGTMRRVFYHYVSSTGQIVLHPRSYFLRHFLSPGASGRIQTPDFRMMSRVVYHCVTGTQPLQI